MLSPARAHFMRAKAAKEAAATNPNQEPTGSSYQLAMAALVEDKRRLQDIQGQQKKAQVKAQLLPQYAPYIQGVIDADAGGKDEVFITLLIWSLDAGEINTALKMAAYALKHNLPAPDSYQRSTAGIIAEEIAEYYLRQATSGESLKNAVFELEEANQLTAEKDMHDQARAKLCKALGYAYRDDGKLESAIAALERALELDSRAGVKKDLAALKATLKKTSEA